MSITPVNRFIVEPPSKTLTTEIELPLSKSVLNRTYMLEYLINNNIVTYNNLLSEDVLLMIRNLKLINNNSDNNKLLVVPVENAGTVARFLLALLTVKNGKFLLTGTERMNNRPINGLVDSLVLLGARIKYLNKTGYLPVMIDKYESLKNRTRINSLESSQYLSALMLIAPLFKKGLEIELRTDDYLKNPYVNMTMQILKRYGLKISLNQNVLKIHNSEQKKAKVFAEFDWSSASFWYQMVSLSGNSSVLFKGLKMNSMQGDEVLKEIYSSLGVNTEELRQGIRISNNAQYAKAVEFSFKNNPDLALPVILTAAALGIRGLFSGLDSLRYKESDRLRALYEILNKLKVSYTSDHKSTILIKSGPGKPENSFQSFADHRVVMSLVPLSLVIGKVEIDSANVHSKSYPGFRNDLKRAGFVIH